MSSLTCFSDKTTNSGWENCYSASNNVHYNFPALMNDSRIWSSWQPEAVINRRIQTQENIHSNWSYRRFLQTNGIKLMNYNNIEACYDLGLDPHMKNGKTPSSNVPYNFKSTFDKSKPGFGYCNSDLKNPYLTREQLNSRLVAPTINPENYHNVLQN